MFLVGTLFLLKVFTDGDIIDIPALEKILLIWEFQEQKKSYNLRLSYWTLLFRIYMYLLVKQLTKIRSSTKRLTNIDNILHNITVAGEIT